MTRTTAFLQGHLFRFVAMFLIGYGVLAWATDAPSLILFLNGIGLSIAAGVCVAYAPVVPDALAARSPSRSDLLGVGVFFVSLSVFAMRAVSFVARDLGWPGVYNSDVLTGVISLGILGGLLHLWAPHAAETHAPRRRWVSAGVAVATGILLAFLGWTASVHLGAPPPIALR